MNIVRQFYIILLVSDQSVKISVFPCDARKINLKNVYDHSNNNTSCIFYFHSCQQHG